MSKDNQKEEWREFAIETARNLARLVEEAESILRHVKARLAELEDKD